MSMNNKDEGIKENKLVPVNIVEVIEFLAEETATEEDQWNFINNEKNILNFFNKNENLEAVIIVQDQENFTYSINKVYIH